MLSQAENQNIYIANGTGLLEYTGAEWNLYKVPNETVVRSVKAVGNRIYTGAYMELGYWERTEEGSLQYTSLLSLLPSDILDGEQFWHIEETEGVVIFQSFENLYLYNAEQERITEIEIPTNNLISSLYRVGGKIYFQVAAEGLFAIEHGKTRRVIEADILGDLVIIHLFLRDEKLRLVTQSGEFFSWDGAFLQPYFEELSSELAGVHVFSSVELPDASILLGTVADGLYQVSDQGELLFHVHQGNGLLNNTVLSLFVDRANNIWAGLDNGISVSNPDSPLRIFQDENGKIGSVYASIQKDDYLYLGTNQGLYFRMEAEKDFRLIPGTHGQVWSLNEIDGELFCGHNNGTYLVKDGSVEKLADRSGTWIVLKLESEEDYYLQGHYNGLSLLRKEGEIFQELPMLKDFPHSAKSIVSEKDGSIWVGNEHKGVFRLRLNQTLDAVEVRKNYQFENTTGITSSIFKFNDTLYYSTKDKIFQYRKDQDVFRGESSIAEIFEKKSRISGKLVSSNNQSIWAFGENVLYTVGLDHLRPGYSLETVYLPYGIGKITQGYENLSQLGASNYLMGMVNGYLLFDTMNFPEPDLEIRIDRIENHELDEAPELVKLSGEQDFVYQKNNLSFFFSIPQYSRSTIPKYSHRLVGLSDKWSDWSPKSTANFKNLSFGEYEFQVRGKLGEKVSEPVNFRFVVNRPWYFTSTAIIGYVLLFLALMWGVHRLYIRHHHKVVEENARLLKMKNLEAQQEIIKLKNQQLEKDIAAKNKELAFSTMSLIKKNEFLSNLKDKLKTSAESPEMASVIRTIDKDISVEDDWNFFKEAFNNADKDFFKKIKSRHPELTSNDLKLCAYLRLNLTSKEIAPLLNISVKSVEIKRYRLRKKMDLDKSVALTDYILDV